MKDFTYRTAIGELGSLVDSKRLKAALAEGGAMKYVKMKLIEELRRAVEKSSLAVFGGAIYVFTGRVYECISNTDFENMTYELWRRLGHDVTLWDKRSGGVVVEFFIFVIDIFINAIPNSCSYFLLSSKRNYEARNLVHFSRIS